MQDVRQLHGVLGLNAGASSDEVKRGYEKRKHAVDAYRGYFATEARSVLCDSALRAVYAKDGGGFALVEQRLKDVDDRWLSELLETKTQRALGAKSGKAATQDPSADKQGLIGGAMGWLGIGKKDAPAAAKPAPTEDGEVPLEEGISATIAGIGELMQQAEQSGGLSEEEIAATNDLLRTLVSKCAEDFEVAVKVVEGMNVAPDLARLVFNPVDVEMRIWSTAAVTLLFLAKAKDAKECLYKKNFADASVVTLFADFVQQRSGYFRELALLPPGQDVDVDEVECTRSVFGNILLCLSKAADESAEAVDQMVAHGLVGGLVCYIAASMPVLSATQLRHACGALKQLVVKSQQAAVQSAQHLAVLTSLLHAVAAVAPAVPLLQDAAGDLAKVLRAGLDVALASGDAPTVPLDLLSKALAQALAQPGLAHVASDVLAAFQLLFSQPADAAAASRETVKDKTWDSFVGTLLANYAVDDVPQVVDLLVAARLLTGVETIGRRVVMGALADEIGAGPKTATPKRAVASLRCAFDHADSAFEDGFPAVAQAVVDKLLANVTGCGPLLGDVLALLCRCVAHAAQLQPSIVSHLVAVLKGNAPAPVVQQCGECLQLLAPKLVAVDKIGSDSQKHLVQLLAVDTTDAGVREALCAFFLHIHSKAPLVALKEALAAMKGSEHACVRDLIEAVIKPDKEAAPAPAAADKKKDAGKKSAKGGEKSTGDVEKKETKGRSVVVSEEAQLRNPLLQKFETERKKIQNRVAEREKKEKALEARQQREEEEKRAAKLRKKTGVIEKAEEEKRGGVREEEREEAKKLFGFVEKESRRLLKEAKEASQRELLLQQAKEEAQRVAEEKQKEEQKRQELLREEKQRREEERAKTKDQTPADQAAAAAAAAAAAPQAEPVAQPQAAPAPAVAVDPQDSDDIDELLAYASKVTKARLLQYQAMKGGAGTRRRTGDVSPRGGAARAGGAGGSYVNPAERRRMEEAAANEKRAAAEEQLKLEAARVRREREALVRQAEALRAARAQRVRHEEEREAARNAHERRVEEDDTLLAQIERQRAEAERVGRIEAGRREEDLRRLQNERAELEGGGGAPQRDYSTSPAPPCGFEPIGIHQERRLKQQQLLRHRAELEAENVLLPPLPALDAQTQKLAEAWCQVLSKLLELINLRTQLINDTSNQERERDEATLRDLWSSREKLRGQIESSMPDKVVKTLRDFYWVRISREDEALMAGRSEMLPESVLPEMYQTANSAELYNLLSGFQAPKVPPTPPSRPADAGEDDDVDASALLQRLGAGTASEEDGRAAPSTQQTLPKIAVQPKHKMYRNDAPPTAVQRRASHDDHHDAPAKPRDDLPEKSTVRMFAEPTPADSDDGARKGGGKGQPATAAQPHVARNGKGAKGGYADRDHHRDRGYAQEADRDARAAPATKPADRKADARGKEDRRQQQQEKAKPVPEVIKSEELFPALGDAAAVMKKKEEEQAKLKLEKLKQQEEARAREKGEKREREQLEDVLKQGVLAPEQKKRLDILRLADERAAYEQRKKQAEIQGALFANSVRGKSAPAQKVEKSALHVELEKEEAKRMAEARKAEEERKREERRQAEQRRRDEDDKRRKQQRQCQWEDEQRDKRQNGGRGGSRAKGGGGGGRGAPLDQHQDDHHDGPQRQDSGVRGRGRGGGRDGRADDAPPSSRDAQPGAQRGGRRGGNRR
eukprot:TRINITY_DN2352_c0_g6_i2.p1 TRINITY_DN2352_c0_g6~~TRINITY_DN2352_c0_g6_i2.p1  ORF type:complete len:1700 (+),score=765.70 TRINITY_DN2352_c0_g6_i2:87-5186(+)